MEKKITAATGQMQHAYDVKFRPKKQPAQETRNKDHLLALIKESGKTTEGYKRPPHLKARRSVKLSTSCPPYIYYPAGHA